MRRVKQRLGAVLGWALAQGFRDDNPARSEALTAALPKQSAGGHQRALPRQVPAAVAPTRPAARPSPRPCPSSPPEATSGRSHPTRCPPRSPPSGPEQRRR